MATRKKYSIYCETEGGYFEGTTILDTPPAECPNDNGHTVTADSLVGLGDYAVKLHYATTNPTKDDDVSDGFVPDSKWVNTDTNTQFVCIDNSSGAAIWYVAAVHYGCIGFAPDVTKDGKHRILGMYDKDTDLAQITSAINPTISLSRSRLVLKVETVTVTGTVQVQGTSYDPATGNTTASDTEDIAISATGYYCTTKYWMDSAVTLVGLTTTDVTADIAEFEEWHIGKNIELTSFFCRWVSTDATNSLNVKIHRYNFTDHDKDTVVNITDADIGASGTRMQWPREWGPGEAVFDHDAGDRLVFSVDVTNAKDFIFEIHYRLL